MAYLKQAKTPEELKSLTVGKVKTAYKDLADDYNRLVELQYVYCPMCGDFKAASNFYSSNKTKSGLEHIGCKACILDMATDYNRQTKERTDNREKTIEVFKRMDLPFIEEDYKAQLSYLSDETYGVARNTAFQQLLTMVKSLPQYKGKTFKDSVFDINDLENNTEESTKIVQKTIKNAKKRFGTAYNNDDLMFLENEYQDWVSRYECNTKAQEKVFKNLSLIELQKDKAIRSGNSTKDLDKSYQDWLDTGSLKPKQNNMDAFSDAQTMGTLLQKYEETRPLPDIDPELEDVDKIGTYIDVFYRGHMSKMLGLKNRFQNLYERFMAKYTVTPPSYDEETDSEQIFEKIFGNRDED